MLDAHELAELFSRTRSGERRAFRDWVEHVTPTVYRLALRMLRNEADAEDVVQETMVRAWQGMAGLRDAQASLSWVCQIARNVALDRVRGVKRRAGMRLMSLDGDHAQHWAETLGDATRSPEELADSHEARSFVRAVIESLPERHRLPLLLCELDGMTAEEAAAALGCPTGTVESRLHRARNALGKKVRGIAAQHRSWRWWR